MFTRFSRRPRTPLAGTLVSLTAHAALLSAVVGDGSGRAQSNAGALGGLSGGEELHWVGTGGGSGGGAPPSRPALPGAPRPIAYVIPGRGAWRTGSPGLDGPQGRHAGRDLLPPPPPVHRRRQALLQLQWALRLPDPPPMADAPVLVPGVAASAPDFARMVSRPEDFARHRVSEMAAGLLDVQAADLTPTSAHVDELPIALVSNPRPTYPAVLARSQVGGKVVVEFVIDSSGAVDVASLRVIQSTDVLFTQAVRSVLPQLRFVPAQVGQRAIGITVRQPFLFVIRPAAF
jgi:protein TonB